MLGLARTFCCLAGGAVSCYIAFVLAAIFVPLALPESLTGSSGADRYAPVLMLTTILLCGVAGFALSWKLTTRWAEK